MARKSDTSERRRTITLSAPLQEAVDEVRRSWPGKVPTESEVLRLLLQEALQARGVLPKQATRRKSKGKDQE